MQLTTPMQLAELVQQLDYSLVDHRASVSRPDKV